MRRPDGRPLRLIARLLCTAAALLESFFPEFAAWLVHSARWLLGLERVLDDGLPDWMDRLPCFSPGGA